MFTIVTSSTIISWARPMIPRMNQRLPWWGSVWAAVGAAAVWAPAPVVCRSAIVHVPCIWRILFHLPGRLYQASGRLASTWREVFHLTASKLHPECPGDRRGQERAVVNTSTEMAKPQVASPSAHRPLRRDAERNRQLILDTAKIVFAQRGLEASLDEVAHEAGLGVGTVY